MPRPSSPSSGTHPFTPPGWFFLNRSRPHLPLETFRLPFDGGVRCRGAKTRTLIYIRKSLLVCYLGRDSDVGYISMKYTWAAPLYKWGAEFQTPVKHVIFPAYSNVDLRTRTFSSGL
ncbi:hypothetical protein EmuJ_001027600 [Echinococcus multilocularis]|uniref:Uncharacterized protein n=1 Tax=Echinococcus multilocularis TaxID=6211 RepID=A0A068YK68_ECHMU|nr:hypothetical protein EmuJ_001027600 [Echinococcus multilocularis]